MTRRRGRGDRGYIRGRLMASAGLCPSCGLPRHEEDRPVEDRIRAKLNADAAPSICYLCLDDALMRRRMAVPGFAAKVRIVVGATTAAMAGRAKWAN